MIEAEKVLAGLFRLDHQFRIYLPSHTMTGEDIATETRIELVRDVMTKFSEWFGGATSYNAHGAWRGPTGVDIEKVTIVEAYATNEAVDEHIADVVQLMNTIKRSVNQDAVALEYDNKMYLL